MRVLSVGDNVIVLRFLPDGRRLLVGTATPRGRVDFAVWPLASGKPVPLRLPKMFARSWWATDFGNPVAVHPSGAFGYVAWDGKVSSFHTTTGRPRPVPEFVRGSEVVISPDGNAIATGHFTPTRREVHTVGTAGTDGVSACEVKQRTFKHLVGYIPEGNLLVTLDDGVYVSRTRVASVPRGKAYHPQLSADGRHLGVVVAGNLYLYDLGRSEKPRKIGNTRWSGRIWTFAFHPSGDSIAVIHHGSADVSLYNLQALKPGPSWEWGCGELSCVAYSPDGLLGAVGSADGRVVVWDVDE